MRGRIVQRVEGAQGYTGQPDPAVAPLQRGAHHLLVQARGGGVGHPPGGIRRRRFIGENPPLVQLEMQARAVHRCDQVNHSVGRLPCDRVTEGVGAAYMAVMSLTITSLVVYGMEAGWSDLRRSFGAIPKAVARMFRQHGIRMWSIVFYGSAVTLLTSGILDPTLAAAFGIGFLAFAPTTSTGNHNGSLDFNSGQTFRIAYNVSDDISYRF